MAPRLSEKTLFLKWALVNAVFIVFLSMLGITFGGRVHGIVLYVIPVILAVVAYGSYLAGRVAWAADDASPKKKKALLHEAHYIDHYAWVAPMLGILSSIAGMSVLLSSNDASSLGERVTSGGGGIFYGTFVGVLGMLLLVHEKRMIEHDLAHPER